MSALRGVFQLLPDLITQRTQLISLDIRHESVDGGFYFIDCLSVDFVESQLADLILGFA
jgi:hypothetical protein